MGSLRNRKRNRRRVGSSHRHRLPLSLRNLQATELIENGEQGGRRVSAVERQAPPPARGVRGLDASRGAGEGARRSTSPYPFIFSMTWATLAIAADETSAPPAVMISSLFFMPSQTPTPSPRATAAMGNSRM